MNLDLSASSEADISDSKEEITPKGSISLLKRVKLETKCPPEKNVQVSLDANNQLRFEFSTLLSGYEEYLKREEAFEGVYKSSTNPKYEEYEAIKGKISSDNLQKFNEFLEIYLINSEAEEHNNFTLDIARKLLISLSKHIFMEGRSPKSETFSLIKKINVHIAYQLSISTSNDELAQWIVIIDEIRIKWKDFDIDMTGLMKQGCETFMKLLKNDENIQDYKILILLNKFAGKNKNFRDKIGHETLELLFNNYEEESRHSAMYLLDALAKNRFHITSNEKNKLKKIERKINHWTFSASRKTRVYRQWIKKWLNIERTSELKNIKIINIQEISNKNNEIRSSKEVFYNCFYQNNIAFVKGYEFTKSSKNDINRIANEFANAIYLSEHNETNCFINIFGLCLEEIEENKCRLNLVMESCSGNLENYKCDENTLSYFADSLLNMCSLLHSHGMSHSGIDPSYILVKEVEGRLILKVPIYGMLSASSSTEAGISQTTYSISLGRSNNFTAPEIRKKIDSAPRLKINSMKSDVFSIGLVLHYLISSKLPPEGELELKEYIANNIKKTESPWLKTLLKNMTNFNPWERKKIGYLLKQKKE